MTRVTQAVAVPKASEDEGAPPITAVLPTTVRGTPAGEAGVGWGAGSLRKVAQLPEGRTTPIFHYSGQREEQGPAWGEGGPGLGGGLPPLPPDRSVCTVAHRRRSTPQLPERRGPEANTQQTDS